MRLQFHFRRTELEDPRWGLLSRSESPGWHRMMLRLNPCEVYFPWNGMVWRSLALNDALFEPRWGLLPWHRTMLLCLKILGARWPSWLPGFEDALSASLPRTSPSVSWHYSAPTQSHIEEYEEKEKKTPKKPQERERTLWERENPVGKC